MTKIVEDCPAYTIYEAEKKTRYDDQRPMAHFNDGDVFGILRETQDHGTLCDFYTLGSVIGYALKNGNCPIEALDRARDKGHKLHWANANSVVITNQAQPKEQHVAVEIGDLIRFQGRVFELVRTPNRNVGLKEVE